MRGTRVPASSPRLTSATTRRWAARRQPPPRTKCKPSTRRPSRRPNRGRISKHRLLRTTRASRIGALVTSAPRPKPRRSVPKSMKLSTSSPCQPGVVAADARTRVGAEASGRTRPVAEPKANGRTQPEVAAMATTLTEAKAKRVASRRKTRTSRKSRRLRSRRSSALE